jgi:hypothetical protein
MIELFQIHSFIYDVIVKHKFVSEPAIPISPRVDRLKIDEWLMRKLSEHWVSTPAVRKLKLLKGFRKDRLETYWP